MAQAAPSETTDFLRSGEPTEPPVEEAEAVIAKAATKKAKVTAEEAQSALEWFLEDDTTDEDVGQYVHTLELNVGTSRAPRWVQWSIRPLDRDEMLRLQTQGQNRAQRRRASQADASELNQRIVIVGTVDPNLREIAVQKGVADPGLVLRHRFRHKPGLIDQIATEILLLSGFEEEDVRDAAQVQAVPNS